MATPIQADYAAHRKAVEQAKRLAAGILSMLNNRTPDNLTGMHIEAAWHDSVELHRIMARLNKERLS